MTLIKSISGIRGTIGGPAGDTLNPLDIVRFTSAYATFIAKSLNEERRPKVVVGRDARISGEMVRSVVCGTLMGMGFDVVDLGLATTPTTELAVTAHHADGGIIITASHNPAQWNALKLLNSDGEFLTAADGAEVLDIAAREDFVYADVDNLGTYISDNGFDSRHVEEVLSLDLVNVEAVKARRFRVCVDAVNSVGGIILPRLLDALGVEYTILNGEPTGRFAHNPEPLEKNLQGIMTAVREGDFDLGIVVDPDVDRLAFISEDGTMFGEEYTLVSVADYILGHTPGNTVSNLSSTRALRDVTLRHGGEYFASAVGEVNVTTKMKEAEAVIALFLSLLAERGVTLTTLRASLPQYSIAKNRIDLTPGTDIDAILARVKEMYRDEQVTDIDGVKIDFADRWVHLRKSNTEPIIRVYSEASTVEDADALGKQIMKIVEEMI